MSHHPLAKPLLTLAIVLVHTAAAFASAHGGRWDGEITLTTTVSTSRHGTVETYSVHEVWNAFVVEDADPGGDYVPLLATWTVRETRSSRSADCSSTGTAQGSGTYPWFWFEVDPFDELRYQIASGGYGGGPEATGVMTVRCRNQPPYEVAYVVAASWLPAVTFAPPGGMLDMIPEEVRATMPPETLEMLLELDGLLEGAEDGDGFALTGSVDRLEPWVLRGSAMREIEGGTMLLTWDLARPIGCHPSVLDERTATEREAARQAGPATPRADLEGADGPTSGAPISAADAANAVQDAVGGERVALTAAAGGGASGIQSFGIRVGGSGRALPSLDTLRALLETTCIDEGSLEGARRLVVGSIQWQGSRFRITVRAIDVETGAVLETAMVDGTGAEALAAAVAGVLARFVGS